MAKKRLKELKSKMQEQTSEFSDLEKGFLDSLGHGFPIFDHITLEASTGIAILDSSSEVVARYMLMNYMNEYINTLRRGVQYLKPRQIVDKTFIEYESSLNRLSDFVNLQWGKVMSDADRINARAELIEKHIIARERS